MKIKKYFAGDDIKLKYFSTRCEEDLNKGEVKSILMPENLKKMTDYQSKLYAEGKKGLIVVFQAMDTAGKDGVIKHVMTSLNPQGMYVASFKAPSGVEMSHDYLWRIHKHAPSRGCVTVFNRSHYEDVIIARVHDLVKNQKLPDSMKHDGIWNDRYEQIRNYESYLHENGIHIVKFFLHLSKDEQRERLLSRIDEPEKNWKFSSADIHERKYWNDYQDAYEKVLQKTSTEKSPWYIIPADQKWFSRYLVSEILVEKFKDLNPEFPKLPEDELDNLAKWREELLND
ncbi:MAG: polyphosphate--nucleotide phosphotransferase [Treponema sp.]|nr:MAG: polyphosphate--nucleotide phosphotransferase [Treponema sp.]